MWRLREQGPPPYDSLWDYEVALSYEHDWNDYPMMPACESQGEMPANLFVGQYSLRGKVRALDLPRAGHRPQFERPAIFARVMQQVLGATR